MQIVQIGTQLTEAVAGLERTQEILSESQEDKIPAERSLYRRWKEQLH